MRNKIVVVAFAVITAVAAAPAQQGKWAAADDPTAKYIIDKERQWAESACTHSSVAEFLARISKELLPMASAMTKLKRWTMRAQ
jgi:hypothetical protein